MDDMNDEISRRMEQVYKPEQRRACSAYLREMAKGKR